MKYYDEAFLKLGGLSADFKKSFAEAQAKGEYLHRPAELMEASEVASAAKRAEDAGLSDDMIIKLAALASKPAPKVVAENKSSKGKK